MAVWSGVNIAGTRLKEIAPEAGDENDPSHWRDLHKQVVNRLASEASSTHSCHMTSADVYTFRFRAQRV